MVSNVQLASLVDGIGRARMARSAACQCLSRGNRDQLPVGQIGSAAKHLGRRLSWDLRVTNSFMRLVKYHNFE